MRLTRSAARVVRLVLAAVVLGCALAAWGFVFEPASLRAGRYRLAVPRWPVACAGIRVAVLADPHVGSPWNGVAKLGRIVALTNGARPDLIMLAGDYVIHDVIGGRFVEPEEIGRRLGDLSAPMGVVGVLGNHDWWFDGARVRRSLEAAGITVLEDAALEVSSGDCRFWIAGVGDYWEARHDVAGALRSVPAGAPVLVLTHNPDIFPLVPDRVSLTVAGHTHGGQVYIPLVGRPIVPSRYGQRFAFGEIVEGGRHLFVCPGLGTSILPVRFLVPPEVSLLELVPETGAAGK